VLVLIGNGLLDLFVLSKHKGVVQVAMRMQLCQRSVAFLRLAVVNEPSVFRQDQLSKGGDLTEPTLVIPGTT